MATNKHAQIRYNVLDKCFKNTGRSYTIDKLLEECNDAIIEFDPNSIGIQKRQLYEDIRFMESEQGWNIELVEGLKKGRRRIYRYVNTNFSINNEPLNESDANQIKAAIFSLSRMKNSWSEELSVRLREKFKMVDDPKKIIEFEENEFLKGKEFISELYNAILYKKVLKIEYKSFKSNHSQIFILFPYYLKQYNSRWFLFGKDSQYEGLSNLALDRIISIEEIFEEFVETEINFEEYFQDVVGVTVFQDRPLQKIILKVDNSIINYVETKAIHGSQKIMERTESFSLVELELISNYEFESRVLSFGEKVEIISPRDLREKIKSRISYLLKKYSE